MTRKMSEKDSESAAAAEMSEGRLDETATTGAPAAHTKLKSRHLYMIAIGGKRYSPCRSPAAHPLQKGQFV